MNILVTGGAGFIGSYIADKLSNEGHSIKIIDNLDPQVHPNGKIPDYTKEEFEFIKGNITNIDLIKKSIKDVDIIFHEAAAVGVGQSMYEIQHYMNANTMGTAKLWDALVNTENDVKKVIVAASMSSYGEGAYSCEQCGTIQPQLRSEDQLKKEDWEIYCPNCNKKTTPIPIKEDAKLNCNSIYAISKKTQEEISLILGRTYGIPTVALRYFNVYGPRQSLSNPYTGVIAIFISRIKNNHQPVVYEDGHQTRDFISVHDIVEANMLAMQKSSADYEVFNVGTNNPLSIKEVAETIAKLYHVDIKPCITNKFRKGDVRHCYANINKIKNKLGFTPKVSFEEGMAELQEWSKTARSEDLFDKAEGELKEKDLF